MAQSTNGELEEFVKNKVEVELEKIAGGVDGRETRGTSTAREVAAILMPGIANIITVAVSAAVTNAVKECTERLVNHSGKVQKCCLINKYENDKLEQYTRRDNLCIFGIEEEEDENEEILEAKLIELTAKMGVKVEPNDISVVHRLGKAGTRNRAVIARFCRRKKRNEIMQNKKVLKQKKIEVFFNEDLTQLRATMCKMLREKEGVESVTTRDGKILAWLTNKERPVIINNPDDLHKVGIASPDWKRLKLDHLIE